MDIHIKRAYEAPDQGDGKRILVDRLWPRGLKRDKAAVDLWYKDIAPSTKLRQWYGHNVERWPEFRRRYFAELDEHPDRIAELIIQMHTGNTTLLYAAEDTEHNNAQALLEYLKDDD